VNGGKLKYRSGKSLSVCICNEVLQPYHFLENLEFEEWQGKVAESEKLTENSWDLSCQEKIIILFILYQSYTRIKCTHKFKHLTKTHRELQLRTSTDCSC